MKIRIARNVFVAGCFFCWCAGAAAATISASCNVLSNGASSRAETIAAAILAACRSSPNCLRTRLNSLSSTVASQSAALTPDPGSMRMSSGPSRRKLKPRLAWSSCGDETPTSRSTPSTAPVRSLSSMNVSSCALCPLINSNLGSDSRLSGADAIACGSRSIAMSRPFVFNCSRMALLCPPRPNVAST